MASYDTNLASEFYVLATLYRLGKDAHFTLGNKKAVDVVVVDQSSGATATVDVKANSKKLDWMIGSKELLPKPNHFLALLSYEDKIADITVLPRCWIVPSEEVARLLRVSKNGTLYYLPRSVVLNDLDQFENAWHLLP